MSYLRQNKSSCGRHPTRPKSGAPEETSFDDDAELPLQTQIDNLRAKISLKQRYNKALLEEVTESHKGANKMIQDLRNDNEGLQHEKIEAIASGNDAAVKALRNHRTFLLTLRGKGPDQVLVWLDDQISDQRKILDDKLYTLKLIRHKLSEAERMVVELEDWPYPGSSPWEQEAIEAFTRLGVAIANRGALKDCVFTLDIKYRELLNQLRGERDTWPYVVLKLEKSFKEYKKELDGLQNMLDDAMRLKKTAYYRLMMTEKEYIDNRKVRHHRIVKIRKMCELELRKNRKRYDKAAAATELKRLTVRRSKALFGQSGIDTDHGTNLDLKIKRMLVAEFEDKAKVLVDAMRVPDLRFCPKRIHTVFSLRNVLRDELAQRQIALAALVKQKNNLLLIQKHLYYTGCGQLEKFQNQCEEKLYELVEKRSQVTKNITKINKIGNVAISAHSALIGLHDILQEGKRNHFVLPDSYIELGKMILEKIKVLVSLTENLRKKFNPNEEPQRNYAGYVKMPISRDACRLGSLYSTGSDEEFSDDDDTGLPSGFGNDRVLTREEIKAKSDKLYAQGMLRKGYRDSFDKKEKGKKKQVIN